MKYKLLAIAMLLLTLLTVNVLAETCTDSDGGKNYFSTGTVVTRDETFTDTCEGKVLKEGTCDEMGGKVYEYKCPGACSDGACVCSDSDSGKDYFTKGLVIARAGDEQVWDSCKTDYILLEGTCDEQGGAVYEYQCPNGCLDGACVTDRGSGSSSIARNQYFLKVNDAILVNVKIVVRLLNVGSGGSIVVSVDNVIEEIPATATKTVNGIEITNIETNYEDTKAERSAVIGVEGEVIPRAVKESVTKAPSLKFSVSCEKERNLDLAMYPAPFLVNGQLNNVKIVVGENAPASDTVAAIDIATKLQYLAKTPTGAKASINPVLASEIINPKNYNLILVGRPSNNHLILEHTAESPAGVGNIRLGQNGDNVALIVTGSIDVEVRWAAKVLSNYEDYKLFGNKCTVKAIDEGEVTYVPKKPEVKEPEKPEYGCVANRICEPEYGENVANCPSDCKEISTPLQCNGCISDGNCLSFGMRTVENNIPKYCDFNKQFIPQKSANAACQNNFECDSNVCAAGKCISEGFLKKIMNWFAKMFGYVVKG